MYFLARPILSQINFPRTHERQNEQTFMYYFGASTDTDHRLASSKIAVKVFLFP